MNIFVSKLKKNKGMTYVEIIVVLSIFSVVSTVAMFNYGDFQARVDVNNLANDIALKIVEAQKSSLSGFIPPSGAPATWKPAYGVYFDINPASLNKSFIYFADLDNQNFFEGTDCTSECLSKVSITKNNFIKGLAVHFQDNTSTALEDLTISFSRIGSAATLASGLLSGGTKYNNADYVQITVESPKGVQALIKVYRSGRVEVD
ncbi:MAG: type II secretion system protein [Minisyncoccia bacterium]